MNYLVKTSGKPKTHLGTPFRKSSNKYICSLAYNVLCLREHEYLLCPNRGHNDEDDPGASVYGVPWEMGKRERGGGRSWRGKTRRGERRGGGKGKGVVVHPNYIRDIIITNTEIELKGGRYRL